MDSNAKATKIAYGVHELVIEGVGKTIAQIKQAYHQVMNLPDQAVAVIDGARVSDDYTVVEGQEVEFLKEAGEKGSR